MNQDYCNEAFTKTEEGIDIDANRLTINCIHSKQNKFDLDNNGNLTVNSLTTIESLPTQINFNLIYPIGSLYFSTNSTDPSTLFGGAWTPFGSGKTIFGIDPNQTEFNKAEQTGGEKTHTLTLPEIPNHNHQQFLTATQLNNASGTLSIAGYNSNIMNNGKMVKFAEYGTGYAGDTASHNNLPPYITCHIWKRTA